MKLKMCTTSKTFDKICLKTIRDTFFQHVVCNQRRDGVRYKERGRNPFLVGSDIQHNGEVQNFGHEWEAYPDPPQKNILRSVLGLNTVIILEKLRECVFSFKATNLQHVRLEMKKGWQNLWWCSIYVRLFIYLKIRTI